MLTWASGEMQAAYKERAISHDELITRFVGADWV